MSKSTIVIPNVLTPLSIARRNTFSTIVGLNLEIWPFTKLYFSSINTWHFISDQNLVTLLAEERMAHYSEISPKHFDLRNIWLWINLMRWRYDACAHWPGLSVRTRTRFKFPLMQSISVLSCATQIKTEIQITNLPNFNKCRNDIFGTKCKIRNNSPSHHFIGIKKDGSKSIWKRAVWGEGLALVLTLET